MENRTAVSSGAVSLTPAQLRERIRQFGEDHAIVAGRIFPIVDMDPVQCMVGALAVRDRGGIPLLGDDRWDAQYWDVLRELAERAEPEAGAAWAAFSSGSSGTPRVILRSESSWSASFTSVTKLLDLESRDVVYLPVPLVSSLSLFSVAHARSVGASLLLPPKHSVSADDLKLATVIHGTPQALRTVIEAIEDGAPHRLRVALIGGDRLDPALRERTAAAGVRLVCYYGAAELSFVAVDSDGLGFRPFEGVEFRVDEDELWVRSPYVALGYLGASMGSLRRDPEGWATVGDMVDLDWSGALQFRGRRDGAILTAAATVVPEDVEAALRTIDGVQDAVVFGLPNSGAGTLVAALVETVPGLELPSARDLRQEASTRLALSHLPRRWFWTERLPRTTAGKPARAQIRDDALAGRMRRLD